MNKTTAVRLILFCLLLFLCACKNDSKSPVLTGGADSNWELGPFQKRDSINPILTPDNSSTFLCPVRKTTTAWEGANVFNPAAVLRNDTMFLLYRAQDSAGTSRIGLAWSTDGLRFTKHATPVLFPQEDAQKKWEWPGGCEDPRMVQDSAGIYFMTYTAYDGKTARLMVASSPDLLHWTKHGPAFVDAHEGRYANFWSKSGSIASDYSSGTPIAKKIGDQYWMYWGDQNIWTATSTDLIHWSPLLVNIPEADAAAQRGIAKEAPELGVALAPRVKKWDSDLVESGPPAMITSNGILLLYNSRNIPAIGDSALAEGTYTAGQALFDAQRPAQLKQRTSNYFLKPEQPYELTGAVNRVCFVEGLVRHRSQWLLYYGTADSKIAVATAQ